MRCAVFATDGGSSSLAVSAIGHKRRPIDERKAVPACWPIIDIRRNEWREWIPRACHWPDVSRCAPATNQRPLIERVSRLSNQGMLPADAFSPTPSAVSPQHDPMFGIGNRRNDDPQRPRAASLLSVCVCVFFLASRFHSAP